MHIAFLTPEYPHKDLKGSAGLGSSIKNLAASLIQAGERVTVFVYSQAEDREFEDQGVQIHSIAKRKYKLAGWYLHRKFLQRYINKIILLEGINVLEAPDWTGITALMHFKCPLVIRLHGTDAYFCHLEQRTQKTKNRWVEQQALKSADHILAVSAFTSKLTKEIFELKKEIQVIPNSIDIQFFKPSKVEAEAHRILYFGTLIRKKGVLELAKICNLLFQKTKAAKLILAGKDVNDVLVDRSTKTIFLEQLQTEYHSQVQFVGVLPYAEIQHELARASVVVLPSFAEALPMTWIEAMAMEKALVTSDIGWANEVMIDGETGYTVNPKEHQQFANSIQELLENSNLRLNMGKKARAHVKSTFATEVVVEQNVLFYKTVINE